MSTWNVQGEVKGMAKSWRDISPALSAAVERIRAPFGRGIAWEGAEIWAYKDRASSIAEVFDRNVTHFGDQEAYVFYPEGDRYTWREIAERVNNAANALRTQYDFAKGDRLCLLSPGCLDYVVGYLAVQKLGGVAVPVNLGLSAEGLITQINSVQAKCLVVSAEIWTGKILPNLNKIAMPSSVFVAGSIEQEGAPLFLSLMNKKAEPLVNETVDEWDLCAISFTSGTTGAPKGTMAMHINALGCAQNVANVVNGLTPADINICMPPLYHNTAIYADFLPAMVTAGKCVVMRAFNPVEAIRIIEAEKATWCVAAPIMLWMIMNQGEFKQRDCTSLKKIAFGGHAASATFINQLAKAFEPQAMVNGGAVSESTALGFALPTADALRKITSCGLATPNTEITVFDNDGNELTEPGSIGEVAYKGQQTNAGYWQRPEFTREVFRKDGYVLSGDWAKIDDDGYLWLLDRKKDMIVRGGQNVYCIEVENKLYMHEKVLSAAVVGVPDHVFSERIKAVVVPKPGQTISVQEIKEHCRQHLANYELPEYVVIANSIPTNPAGKTLKPSLIDLWSQLEDVADPAVEQFHSFFNSIAADIKDKPHLNIDGTLYTPNAILTALEKNNELGELARQCIQKNGIIQMLKPAESRFGT